MAGDPKGSVDPNLTRSAVLQTQLYPCMIPAVSFALNDLGCQQHILSNLHNFAEDSKCDLFEITEEGVGRWTTLQNHQDVNWYFQRHMEPQQGISMRIFFIALYPAESATFGCQLSLNHSSTQLLLQHLAVRPEYIPLMLGKFGGNHLPPGYFDCYDIEGQLKALGFICQQPRWGFRVRQWPISTWTGFDERGSRSSTNCIVSYGADDSRIASVKGRLISSFLGDEKLQAAVVNASDPFLIPTMISHETFMQSDSSIFGLGQRLYGAVDMVDKVAETSYHHSDLETVTFQLHQVSQDADSAIQSADIAISIMESLMIAQKILMERSSKLSRSPMLMSFNSAQHLARGVKARKRWLLGAKSRKDTTMNLVYNIVSQKEAETSLAIARDMKNDSSSMKAIAGLTMVFLPATAVISFFGMSFFSGKGGSFTVVPEWWIFIAVTIPPTVFTIIFWWLWEVFGIREPKRLTKTSLKVRMRALWRDLALPKKWRPGKSRRRGQGSGLSFT